MRRFIIFSNSLLCSERVHALFTNCVPDKHILNFFVEMFSSYSSDGRKIDKIAKQVDGIKSNRYWSEVY